jgi:hypothetical protein
MITLYDITLNYVAESRFLFTNFVAVKKMFF